MQYPTASADGKGHCVSNDSFSVGCASYLTKLGVEFMSKTKSISDLVTQLQEENEQAKYFVRLFNNAVKHEFNYTVNELHELILKYKAYESKFNQREAAKQGQQPVISQSEM